MSKYNYQESEYKKRLRKEAEEEASNVVKQDQKGKDVRSTFLDETQPVEVRLEAVKLMGPLIGPIEIEKAIAIFKDKNQPETVRSLAFSSIATFVLSEGSMIEEAIHAVKVAEGDGHIAMAALRVLQLAENTSPRKLEPYTAAYKDALRSVIDHKNKNLRAAALEILAIEKDDYAQRRLVESLETPGDDLIEPEVAIQLLAYDLHTNHYPILRKIAHNPPNTIAKREALRNLGADVEAIDLLSETLKNTEEDPETRHAAAAALSTQAPDLAAEQSKRIIVVEKGESVDELKTALLNTLMYMEKESTSDKGTNFLKTSVHADDFANQLQDLKITTRSTELQNMIDLYLNNRK